MPRRRRLEVAGAHGPRRQHGHRRSIRRGCARPRASLVAEGVEAIAICFLHAYRNPAHERAAGAAIRAALPDVAVSLSSDVVAELWEYQRCATTCANAYVQPLMDRYVRGWSASCGSAASAARCG